MSKEPPVELLSRAVSAARNAYAPYSGFAVGAALETADGTIHVGANMENASYGLTTCAEVGALQAATTAGKLADVVRIAVVGGSTRGEAPSDEITTPCGRCRQLIVESARLSGTDIEVWCSNLALGSVRCFRISELLPHAFGPSSLRSRPGDRKGDSPAE